VLTLSFFLAACVLCGTRSFHAPPAGFWPEAALLLLALPASVAALGHQLAVLNIGLAGIVAGLIGGLVMAVDRATGIPFGGIEFSHAAGPTWGGILPWSAPCLWFAVTLCARGTARFLLHRQPARPRQGYWVLAGATAIGGMVAMLLLRYGSELGLWSRPHTGEAMAAAALFALHLIQQIAVTPLLLDKFPHPRPANPLPLLVVVPAMLVLLLTLLRL
jgi:hypothetical protein